MKYLKIRFIIGLFAIISVQSIFLYAQKDIKVTPEELRKIGTNYYNYSDPSKINIEVKVLGGVRNPGIYLIPEGTSVIDILSLSGNILQEETADNIKLIRTSQHSGKLTDHNVITLNYRDMFSDDEMKSINKINPVLTYGDILIIPMTPERTFWDFFSDFSTVITPLATLATLVISIIALSRQ